MQLLRAKGQKGIESNPEAREHPDSSGDRIGCGIPVLFDLLPENQLPFLCSFVNLPPGHRRIECIQLHPLHYACDSTGSGYRLPSVLPRPGIRPCLFPVSEDFQIQHYQVVENHKCRMSFQRLGSIGCSWGIAKPGVRILRFSLAKLTSRSVYMGLKASFGNTINSRKFIHPYYFLSHHLFQVVSTFFRLSIYVASHVGHGSHQIHPV